MANHNNIISIDDEEDDDVEYVSFGSFRANIVGIRYYKGRVNNNEMVSLIREPRNNYDSNAIRVDNVGHVQVGHIKREQAKALAKIVDSGRARLEGVVPCGMNNKFTMPCQIALYGKETNKQAVTMEMKRAGHILSERGSAKGSGVYELDSLDAKNSSQNTVKVSQQAMKRELDNMFLKLTESVTSSSAEAAEAIKTTLFPHQKQALAWMISCENDDQLPPFWEQRGPKDFFNSATNFSSNKKPEKVQGGILADDMGLGKTLEMIALIVTNFKNNKNLVTIDKSKPLVLKSTEEGFVAQQKQRKRTKKKAKAEDVSEILDDYEPNLPDLPFLKSEEIIKPEIVDELPLVMEPTTKQPRRAAKRPVRYTLEDDDEVGDEEKLMVKIPKKELQATQTSRKNPTKAKRSSTGTSAADISPASLSNGVTETVNSFKSTRTKAAGPRATLIICPLSVLSNWQDQIALHVWPGLLDVYTYYGVDRIRDSDILAQKDVVLTTYQTLTSDFHKPNSPLGTTRWLRVVLDEGHCIRNPNTLQSKAVFSLEADRRWVVTGTPIQNSMKDLWSIVCFLRLDPFKDKQWWTRVIERPIKQGEEGALIRLQQLMKRIALRRTKTQEVDGKPLVDIPPKNIFINYIELSKEERDIYQAVAEKGKVTIGKYMKAGTLLTNYAEVLVILTRLRQLCCHPKLCAAALEAAAKAAAESSTPEEQRKKLASIISIFLSSGVDEECSICLDSLCMPVITHCAHIYCKKCIENVIERETAFAAKCPLCRRQIALDQLVDAPADQEEEASVDNGWNSSAKVDFLMAALEKQRRTNPLEKCLVVSQFTSFLKLLKQPLEGRGFNYVSLDGSMSQEKRVVAIREFSDNKPGSPTIFLLSLKAGGVGLNLSAATKVYLLDPAWNPAAEDQCFDRCHRLGQTKEVNVFKFVIKNSIEERMLELQEKKRKLMSGAFEKKKPEERRQQKIDDVTALLNTA